MNLDVQQKLQQQKSWKIVIFMELGITVGAEFYGVM